MFRARRLAAPVSALAAFATVIGLPAPALAGTVPEPKPRSASPVPATVSPVPTLHASSADAAPRVTAGGVPISRAALSGSATTIFVGNAVNCLNKPDTGDGTAANPYCSVQDAVNAAVPGDTISVASSQGYYYGAVTVKTSDISIVGAGPASWIDTGGGSAPALVLDHVSHVTVSDLYLNSSLNTVVQIVASTNVTVDSDTIEEFGSGSGGLVSVDGASSSITVSRSLFVETNWSHDSVGVALAAGAQNVDIASNIISDIGGGGVAADAANGVDVVGNTIQRSCGAGVALTGSSANAFVENNLLEDANPVTDSQGVGDQSFCASHSDAWEPDVTVDATSAPGVVSDHNDFYSYGSDGTAPYGWAGSTYSTLAAFQSATSQGAHDVTDTVEAVRITLDQYGAVADALLQAGSAAIGAANEAAPGVLSDLYGYGPNPDCGAIALADKDLIARLNVENVSYLTVSVDGYRSNGYAGVSTYAFDWGDGTSTAPSATATSGHEYQAAGTYTITLTVTDVDGDKATATASVTVAPPDDHMVADISGSYIGALTIMVGDENSTGDDGIASSTFFWGDGTSTTYPATGSASHTYTAPGVYTVKVTIKDKNLDTASASVNVPTLGSQYTAYGPARLLDTRKGIGTGTAGSAASVKPGGTVTLTVGGANAIPAGVTAVAMNLTVADQQSGGYITAYPAGLTRPTTSNVNFTPGAPTANMTIVPVGDHGGITFYNGSAGTVDLIADVSGYFSAQVAQGYAALPAPDRFLDTRSGVGGYPGPVVTSSSPVKLKIAGVGAIPVGVSAVAVNLTVAGPTGGGYITAWPDGETRPVASNINFTAGQVRANAAIVPVGSDGYIDIALSAPGGARLIADVAGYFSAGGSSWYVPVAPYRYIDTRKITNGQLPAGYYYQLYLASGLSFSSRNITTFILNTTVTAPAGGGYLTVFPDGDSTSDPVTIPTVSTLNFTAGQTVPNLTYAIPSYGDGYTDFYNGSTGSLQLVVDVYGFFSLA